MSSIIIVDTIAEIRSFRSHRWLTACHLDAPSHFTIVLNSKNPSIVVASTFVSLLIVIITTSKEVFFTLVNSSCYCSHMSQFLQLGVKAELGIIFVEFHYTSSASISTGQKERLIIKRDRKNDLRLIFSKKVVSLLFPCQILELIMIFQSREQIGSVRHFLSQLDQLHLTIHSKS